MSEARARPSLILLETDLGNYDRFVLSPITDLKARLETQSTELKGDAANLEKKLHYLETTAKNSREHIDQLLRSGGRA